MKNKKRKILFSTKHDKFHISKQVELVDKCRQGVYLRIYHQFFRHSATLLSRDEQMARTEKEPNLIKIKGSVMPKIFCCHGCGMLDVYSMKYLNLKTVLTLKYL